MLKQFIKGFIICATVLWLAIGYIVLDFSPLEWTEVMRYAHLALSGLVGFIFVAVFDFKRIAN